jgi:hypothetical protein
MCPRRITPDFKETIDRKNFIGISNLYRESQFSRDRMGNEDQV